MKYKVSELQDAQLDAAVAKAEGKQWESQIYGPDRDDWCVSVEGARFAPSQEWDQGGPIIDLARITVLQMGGGILQGGSIYFAFIPQSGTTIEHGVQLEGLGLVQKGKAYLIAAMRAYVASKFGEEVELT